MNTTNTKLLNILEVKKNIVQNELISVHSYIHHVNQITYAKRYKKFRYNRTLTSII